jgi:hypothetical protein
MGMLRNKGHQFGYRVFCTKYYGRSPVFNVIPEHVYVFNIWGENDQIRRGVARCQRAARGMRIKRTCYWSGSGRHGIRLKSWGTAIVYINYQNTKRLTIWELKLHPVALLSVLGS